MTNPTDVWISLCCTVMKEPSQHSGSQVSSMFAINDVRSKLYNSEPASSIFDGPAVGKALTMRSSSNYPSSIIDRLRSNRITKSFGTSEVIGSSGMGRRVAGTSSDTAVTSGELTDSSSGSDSDDSSDRRLPAISFTSEAHNGSGSKNVEKFSVSLFETQAGDQQGNEAAVQRRQKKTEVLSSTDSESDTDVSGCISKSKATHSKSRKRRKKLTANLAGTRYDVGKNLIFCSPVSHR